MQNEKLKNWIINEMQLKYLKKNIDYLNSQNIPFILVQTPITEKLYNSKKNNEEIDALLSSLGIYKNFQNTLELNDSLDFYDSNHLNQKAVEAFNLEFIKYVNNQKIL